MLGLSQQGQGAGQGLLLGFVADAESDADRADEFAAT